MRIFYTIVLFAIFIFNAVAQDAEPQEIKTLVTEESLIKFKDHCYETGLYVGNDIKATVFGNRPAALSGIRTGFYVSDNFTIGVFQASTIVAQHFQGYDFDNSLIDVKAEHKYFGASIEYIFFPNNVFHLSFPINFGIGKTRVEGIDDFFNNSRGYLERSHYLVLDPGMYLNMHLIHHLFLKVGASYRYCSQSKLINYSDYKLSNLSINMNLTYKIFGN
jgi:hypothetical protein